jgi:hypothetical protein
VSRRRRARRHGDLAEAPYCEWFRRGRKRDTDVFVEAMPR